MACDEVFDISHMFDLLRQVIKRMDVAGFACNLLMIFKKIESTPVEFTFQFNHGYE